MRPPLRPVLAAALGLSLLGLTACSGDDSGGSADDPPSASSTSEAGTPSEEPTGSTEPTDEPTDEPSDEATTGSTAFPGVTPAAGPEFGLDTVTMHAPEGWEIVPSTISGQQISASAPGGRINFIEQANAADVPVDARAQVFTDSHDDGPIERLPDVTLGEPGVQAARFEYSEPPNKATFQAVVGWRNGYSITLIFELDQALLKEQPDLVDSVLASITWK